MWKALTPQQQEIIKSAANETFIIWWAKWQKQNADAIEELQEKHGVQILRTPPDILIAFLKAWDKIAAEEGGQEPVLQEGARVAARVRRAWWCRPSASCFPPYSFAANYYWPEKAAAKPATAAAKK